MQRQPIEILVKDEWPQNVNVLDGVVRQAYCTYQVNPAEHFGVVAMTPQGTRQTDDNRLLVEIAAMSEGDVNRSLTRLIRETFKEAMQHSVHVDRLHEFMAAHRYTQLLCHPDVRLSGEASAIRHADFEPPEAEHSTVYACQDKPGVLIRSVSDGNVHFGVFIRTQKFCKIRLDSPIPTAWELLDTDPFA